MRKLVAASLGAMLIGGAIALSGGVSMAQAPGGGIVQKDQFAVMNQAITQLQQVGAQLNTQASTQSITQLQQIRKDVYREAGTHYKGHRVQAIHLIEQAITHLKKGHSDQAMNLINQAISELQQGVAAAKAMGAK